MNRISMIFLGIIIAMAPASTVSADSNEKIMDLLIKKGVITQEEGESLKEELKHEEKAGEKQDRFMAVKQKTKFKGDLRLRYDTQRRDEGPGKDDIDRQRWRYRLRFGTYMEPTETTELGIRLASGAGEQNTTNQSYDTHARGKDIFIDQVYANWKPVDWFTLIGGKHENPFFTSALVWDPDVNLEGISEKVSYDVGNVELFANLTQFFVEELNIKATDNSDPLMLGYQVGAKLTPAEDMSLELAATYYDFNNLELLTGAGALDDDEEFIGYNQSHSQQMIFDASGNLLNEFGCYELGAKFKAKKLLPVPFSIFGSYIKNKDADIRKLQTQGAAFTDPSSAETSDPADLAAYGGDDRDSGYQIGFDVGSKKKKGDLYFQYFYQELEDFAFPAIFVDSDFHGGGTNNKGHRAKVNYYLKDNVYLQGAFFFTERENEAKDGKKDEDRAQLDVIFKF